MEVAEAFQQASKEVKRLKKDLSDAQVELRKREAQMIELIEGGKLPESFKLNDKPIYTREDIWASAKNGDHDALVAVLNKLGLTEYLPKTVNSQSISGFVRGFKDEDTGELVGIPDELLAVLNITKTPRVIASGLG